MAHLTVAALQIGTPLFDTPATLAKARQYIADAAHRGARVIVLPEAYLGGYPKGLDFGVTVGARSDRGREEFRRYFESAVRVPGPETDSLAALAQDLGVHIVAGVVERAGATLYCTALFFGPGAGPGGPGAGPGGPGAGPGGGPGGLLAKHRKLVPTAGERLLWGRGDGSTLPVVDTGEVRLGSAICWENYMPLLRTAMYAKGVDVWCAPSVDPRESWQVTMRHVALEGRCFVVCANQYLLRSDLPADLHPVQGEAPGTVLIDGGSVIVSPLGAVLAGPLRGGEGILTADLDLGDLARARFDFDPVGHYARPDVFTLLVDDRERT
ncbi:nitrilase-related carbon-nitrogen hydrolase [Streptomyces sp. HPF1205]|uniref:nitrilase-related carbon-nitrogen hydrolase n=1 Tax=Streptomyces sp. HPF1205 TaxID=2873262 RepID=UPI001CED795A|nr:nitrilase-related carbon-nitrogen hydrolase [Streptomyces sp. HPF1205]